MLRIGETPGRHTSLYWKGVPNGHIFISGQSGSGKSYFTHGLILQLLYQGKVRCIVLDASHDLAGGLPTSPGLSLEDRDQISVVDVKSENFTLNPIPPLPLGDGKTEDYNTAAARVVESLMVAYRLSSAQGLYLTNTIRKCLEYFDGECTIPALIAFVNTSLEKDERKRVDLAVARLENFAHCVHCGTGGFDWRLDTPGVTVIDFSRVPTEREQQLLVELSLADIWGQRMRKKDALIPTIIVLDECQKYKFKSGNYTTKLLREGRKYRISAWFASQWISDKEALAALEQAALRAYFRPEPSNVHALARRLAAGDRELTKTYEIHLGRLKRGQFLYHDQNGRPIIANVPSRTRP